MKRYDIDLFEVWKPVLDFDGYEVSSYGRIWSNKKHIIMSPGKQKSGYYIVCFQKGGKSYTKSVHRLVAEAFIPNPNNLPQVNHKDENKGNNTVENLEWCTSEYNINYGTGISRMVNTNVKNGRYDKNCIGKTKAERMKIWREKHPDLYRLRNRENAKRYYYKKKLETW